MSGRTRWRGTSIVVAVAAAALALAPAPAAADEDVLLAAMSEELARSIARLELADLAKPYFVSYRVDDVERLSASASLGGLLSGDESRWRFLVVELRVGSYQLDNTNFLDVPDFRGSGMVRSFGGVTPLPLDDDEREIRRQIWLATDAAYKQAAEDLAKKQAVLKTKTRTEEVPDFSEEEVVEVRDDRPAPEGDLARMEALVRDLSARFRRAPEVFTSRVEVSLTHTRSLYVNSEGSRYTRSLPRLRFEAVAGTQAADGQTLEDFVTAYGRDLADLPPRDELAERVDEMAGRLAALRRAELVERYNGPVLFEAAAAAELFAQVFMPSLSAVRRPLPADERIARFAEIRGGGFEDRLGARVLPRFLSVIDDPTRSEFDGVPLQAGYRVDDEGVPARPTAVIERGYLKTLLAGRTPVTGVEHSSGNRRAGAVVPSNLVVAADPGLSGDELRKELLLLVKDRGAEFGVVVRRLGNPLLKASDGSRSSSFSSFGGDSQQPAAEPAVAAYKLYPDGREVLVRNVEISGLTAATFKEIVAAGDRPEVADLPITPRTADPFRSPVIDLSAGGPPIVSLAIPPLLFEELTLKAPSGEIPRLPVAPRPGFSE